MVNWNHFLKVYTDSDTSEPVELAHCPTEVKDNETLFHRRWTTLSGCVFYLTHSHFCTLHISLFFLHRSLLCWGLWTVHSFVYWLILHQMNVFESQPNKTSKKIAWKHERRIHCRGLSLAEGYSNRACGELKSVEHREYENTTMTVEITARHLLTQCPVLTAGEYLKLNQLCCKAAEIRQTSFEWMQSQWLSGPAGPHKTDFPPGVW